MTDPSRAVFLSHASQDVSAAARICGALQDAGVEVWFDQSELRGGDAWDQRIRQQIRDCALFIPVISANTTSRHEGYFRLEWDLADQRSHMIARNRAFIVPVCLDATADTGADVPESFQRVQWTRLPNGETPPEFSARIKLLLVPESTATSVRQSGELTPAAVTPLPAIRTQRLMVFWLALVAVFACVAAYMAIDKLWISKHTPGPQPITEKSIAVLPFADMSEKKDQEYFADGLAEELLNLLAKTPGLHVIARTSSFSFKGKADDIPTIAAKLRVADILEGSVRKSGDRLRVTTQLVRAADGEHLWSETFDRELKDVFKVQDEIAEAVVTALKLKLSPGQTSSPSRSPNMDAYLQYLLGQQYESRRNAESYPRAVAAYRSAIALDPQYAAAYAGLAVAEIFLADVTGEMTGLERASVAAEQAIALAPEQAMGYGARGVLRVWTWDWTGAQADFARALELDPNNPTLLHHYSALLAGLGRLPEAVKAARSVVDLDPFSVSAWQYLAGWLMERGDLGAAREACRHALAIDPANEYVLAVLGYAELLDKKFAEALAVFQRIQGNEPNQLGFRLTGIAMAEHSLGHARESKQALDEATAKGAQAMAYQIAEAYAWRGEPDRAFEWLELAYRQHDGGLGNLKADPLLNSLHGDPRFSALLKKINLPV